MRLMSAFYGHLHDGHGKADALRRAKLDMLARGAAPRDWAGFVLLGEPAGTVPALAGPAAPRAPAALALLVGLAAAAGGAWALGRRPRR
jgi:hypothetical protein